VKWIVYWRRPDRTGDLQICENMDWVLRLLDFHRALRRVVWIEDQDGRTIDLDELSLAKHPR
jgi:hypothetical protein